MQQGYSPCPPSEEEHNQAIHDPTYYSTAILHILCRVPLLVVVISSLKSISPVLRTYPSYQLHSETMLWEIGSLLQYNLTHQSLPGYCALFEEDSAENGDLSMCHLSYELLYRIEGSLGNRARVTTRK